MNHLAKFVLFFFIDSMMPIDIGIVHTGTEQIAMKIVIVIFVALFGTAIPEDYDDKWTEDEIRKIFGKARCLYGELAGPCGEADNPRHEYRIGIQFIRSSVMLITLCTA